MKVSRQGHKGFTAVEGGSWSWKAVLVVMAIVMVVVIKARVSVGV